MSFNTFIKVAEIEKAIDGYKLGEIAKQECMSKLARIFQELADEVRP